jgi:hypothetical protein
MDDDVMEKVSFEDHVPSPENQRTWELMRRDDLASVVGVVFWVPFHGQDESGHFRFGLPPVGGSKNPEIADEFEREMRQIIADGAKPLLEVGILSEEQIRAIEGHPYETGPAAADWWQYCFEIYGNVDTILSVPANLFAIAEAVKLIKAGAQRWKQRKQEELERDGVPRPDGPQFDLDPQPVLTLPGLVALCYDDLVRRHGESSEITITVHPRNRWAGYGSADHPGAGENYVIRLESGPRSYFYLVDGNGRVYEHYRTANGDVELLPIPDLLPDEISGNALREPERPRQFVVRLPPSSNEVP